MPKHAPADSRRLAESIISMRSEVRLCDRCFNVTDSVECSICRDLRRDPSIMCAVERPQDIVVVENANKRKGYPDRMRRITALIDVNGVVHVSAQDLKTAKSQSIEMDTEAGERYLFNGELENL